MLLNSTHLPVTRLKEVRSIGMEVTPASHLAQQQLSVWEGWIMSLLVLAD